MNNSNKNWLDYFDKYFFENLNSKKFKKSMLKFNTGERGEGFRIIFDHLASLRLDNYTIIETGTMRSLGSWGDGQSSILFESFLKHYNGSLFSVDISKEACDVSINNLDKSICSVICNDSVTFLKDFSNKDKVDLFYLDSYDVHWKNDNDSATHHLNEFLEIESYLKKNSIVAIDDNNFLNKDNRRTGKGRKIFEYLYEKNIFPIYDKYQIIYKF